MHENSLGQTIRELRLRAGLTQEQLAEGVCSPVSVSRIETGKQMPSKQVLDALLARLGSGTYELCDVFVPDERERRLVHQLQDVQGLISAGDALGAQRLLDQMGLEQKPTYGPNGRPVDYPELEQTKKIVSTALLLARKTDYPLALHTIEDAVRLTKPDIDFDDLRDELLSPREANALGIRVVVLHRIGRTIDAIRFGEELMRSLERHRSGLAEYRVVQITLAFNLAQCLYSQQRFQESYAYVRKAKNLSMRCAEQVLLPEIFALEARAFQRMGRVEEARSIRDAVVPYMELLGKHEYARRLRDAVR